MGYVTQNFVMELRDNRKGGRMTTIMIDYPLLPNWDGMNGDE